MISWNFEGAKGRQAGSKMKLTPLPLRLSGTLSITYGILAHVGTAQFIPLERWA